MSKLLTWHVLWVIAIGYLLGYYFPRLGEMTVGKVIPTPR